MEEVTEELKKYIEECVLPEYAKNEPAHAIEHIKYVLRRSFEIIKNNNLDVNYDMVYTIAAYHDIGHHIDSKNHEKISADMLHQDQKLRKFFSEEDIITMVEAVEDHRASLDHEPRSIYGKIVSTADRNNTVNLCLRRTYTYGKKLDPEATDTELFHRAYNVLKNKFGENGYAKFFFKDVEYEKFLKEIRTLLQNENNFIKRQREYIAELKNKKEL